MSLIATVKSPLGSHEDREVQLSPALQDLLVKELELGVNVPEGTEQRVTIALKYSSPAPRDVRVAAGHAAKLLETTYVPHAPWRADQNCAVTAIGSIHAPYEVRERLEDEVRERISSTSISHWSDTSGKDTVVGLFRDIAEGR